jgi:hypothetical protein
MDRHNPTDLISIFENTHYQQQSQTVLNENLLVKTIDTILTEFEKKLYQFFLNLTTIASEDDNNYDFDIIWPWLGFSTKESAKHLLETNFVYGRDYSDNTGNSFVHNTARGGHNKQFLFISISTFKHFCILSKTPRAKEIQNYFLKMENILVKFIGGSIGDFLN